MFSITYSGSGEMRPLAFPSGDAMTSLSGGSASGLRILVADDDDDFRSLLIEMLEQAGHRVIEIEDGFELEDYLELSNRSVSRRLQPDVIVTDVRMPGRSGLEVVRDARRAGLMCPVIVLSAYSDEALRDEARALGRMVVLSKPVDADEVAQLVWKMTQN